MHLLQPPAGSPKAVIVPHSAVIANILQVTASAIPRVNSSPGDKALGVIPVSHMFGLLTLIHVCPYLGISSVLFSSMPPFERFLDILGALKVNHLFLAPPLVSAFLKHPATAGRQFDYFKSCVVAAAPLDADRESAFRKLGGPSFLLSQGFGMTETGDVPLHHQSLTTSLMYVINPLQRDSALLSWKASNHARDLLDASSLRPITRFWIRTTTLFRRELEANYLFVGPNCVADTLITMLQMPSLSTPTASFGMPIYIVYCNLTSDSK
jgi:acyl-CoA synthetase (AMP-forming)/AMP-acid ligase II